jgi:hypothetical protein
MNKCTAQSAFFNLRVLIGLLITSSGVILALLGFGTLAVPAAGITQAQHSYTDKSIDPLIPGGFDCSKIHELGIDKQVNLRARAIMIACGVAEGGSDSTGSTFSQWIRNLLPAPLVCGGTDVDLINGAETYPNIDLPESRLRVTLRYANVAGNAIAVRREIPRNRR